MLELKSKPRIKSLKKLSDTRWACRSDAIQAVYENFTAIKKALEEIEEQSSDSRVATDAGGLVFSIMKFEFCICLVVLKDILFKCRTVSDYFQREDIDIVSALQVVDTTVKTIKEMQSKAKFKLFYDEATEFADNVGIEISEPRARKISHRLDANWSVEHTPATYQDRLHVCFFYEVLDIILNEFQSRFNQESRIYLSLLGDLQKRKLSSDSLFAEI